ncbi:DUF3221 domain-containing protein [Aureibacillus halotolerans]|uniref:Uncharacterized protein DUF3221 n=1 Tax=Aureibacillus halotolerans TaxID=1508390 RepID=A0A4R6TSL0_9BACI|nr:DUF3221 domain-containing protein [Aureibacillus halotolerans]TDQ36618.1 uncharacterized protein DUF3221 [Aureibacillus halotolerans]
MKALIHIFLIGVLSVTLLIGCSEGDTQSEVPNSSRDVLEGIVQEKDATTILISNGSEGSMLYSLVTKDVAYDADVGDKIKVWTTGQYRESYPVQGVATKIVTTE